MSGYCPDCGNTRCECDEVTKATYPYRMKIKELEGQFDTFKDNWQRWVNKELDESLQLAVEALELSADSGSICSKNSRDTLNKIKAKKL